MQKCITYGFWYPYVTHSTSLNLIPITMNREQALQLVNKLLDPNTQIDEKQRAAAQLQELIKILLPE